MERFYVNSENVRLMRKALETDQLSGNFFPSVYVVEPTNKCNLKCIMCPNRFIKEEDLGEMSLSLFSEILEVISPFAEFVMLYWLGEPLLNGNITEMLTLARRKIKGRIVVSTNLSQTNDDLLNALLENTDTIICSLDRWDALAYEKIRKGASFLSVVSNIERLIDLRRPDQKCEIVVKALDISLKKTEYNKFKEYWSNRSVRLLHAWVNDWAGTFPSLRKTASIPIPHMSPRTPCADLWFKMVINWRGNIQLCCFDWQNNQVIGNCESPDWLRSTWQGEKIISLRSSHVDKKFASSNLCKKCTTWGTISEYEAYVDFDDNSYFLLF